MLIRFLWIQNSNLDAETPRPFFFRGRPHSLQGNSTTMPSIRPRPLQHSFQLHFATLLLDAVEPQLTASFNKS